MMKKIILTFSVFLISLFTVNNLVLAEEFCDLEGLVPCEATEDVQKEKAINTLTAKEVIPKEKVNVYFFWGEGCPHCEEEKPFLEKMKAKYPEIEIHDFEVWNSSENRKLMQDFGKKLNATVNGVPFTVIGEHYTVGWMDEANTGVQIEDAINCAIQEACRDVGEEIKTAPKH